MPIFEKLAAVSKFMEGENYILSSSYWGALHTIEVVLEPQARDSPVIASVRHAMYLDHYDRRITLDKSVQMAVHVFMHLLDPRYGVTRHQYNVFFFFCFICSYMHLCCAIVAGV